MTFLLYNLVRFSNVFETIEIDCGTSYDCPTLQANIGDSCDDGLALTENDVINANCECKGTPVQIYDCPIIQANIGDACDDVTILHQAGGG